MRKVCVVTSNRADYWLLKPLLKCLRNSDAVQLQLLVSGAHLSDEFGNTLYLITQDGFHVDAKVECLSETDDQLGMIQALSEGVLRFAKAFQEIEPELIVILGDRFEIFAAAQAAYCLKLPIAHLHGGELTQATLDEGFRHATSKFSHLHFVSHPEYKARLMRMGEQPDLIWVTGAIGIDHMDRFKPVEKSVLSEAIHFNLDRYILLTCHPSTLDNISTETMAAYLMTALEAFPEYQLLITQTNPDPGGRLLNAIWNDYLEKQPGRICFTSTLGNYYHSAVYHAQCVVGNSSSGILEVPYLGRRTINIGKRQMGRIFPKSVSQVGYDATGITDAISTALQNSEIESDYVYGQPGMVASTISGVLESFPLENIVSKQFYDA